jgi:DegV family protein with EDD domain
MANKVAIITDSTINLPDGAFEEYNIQSVPLIIQWDGKSYIDQIELTTKEFYERLATSKTLPSTSQPSISAFVEVYQPLIDQGYDIITLPLSAGISGTFLSASAAAGQFPIGRIEVLDVKSVSVGLGIIVMKVARAAKAGASLQECREIALDVASRVKIYFSVETLENLRKGGRINSAAAFLGTALDMKPILEFRGGLIEAKERVRTSKKAHARLLELTEEIAGHKGELEMVGFVSAAAQPAMEELRQAAHERFTIKEEFSGELSPVLGTHVGIGTVGIAFLA